MGVLEGATTIFFTGGDQLRLTTLLGDTPVFSRCYEIFAGGGAIAGTSAGAAVMSETMIVRGNGEGSPRIGDLLQWGRLLLRPERDHGMNLRRAESRDDRGSKYRGTQHHRADDVRRGV